MGLSVPVVLVALSMAGAGVASAKPPVAKPSVATTSLAKPSVAKPPSAKAPAPKAKAATPPSTSASTADGKSPKPAPFVKHIERNPALVTRLQALLPAGTSLETAAAGFKNQGQFIAALHVSHNLNIPFADLKAAMTGTPHESLGQAIQQLKPGVDATQAAKLAAFEGKVDIEEAKEDAHDNHTSAALKSGPFIKRLQSNSQLVALLTPLLPSGTSISSAAQGFKSEEQFIAALHAAQNLNIPFAQLKAEMTGHDHDKLAVAIFEQKPSVDALAEARKAQGQAKSDLQSTDTKH